MAGKINPCPFFFFFKALFCAVCVLFLWILLYVCFVFSVAEYVFAFLRSASWVNQTEKLPDFANSAGVYEAHHSPADPRRWLFVPNADSNVYWITKDGGETYARFESAAVRWNSAGGNFVRVRMHPTLGHTIAVHNSAFVYVSTDFAETWHVAAVPVRFSLVWDDSYVPINGSSRLACVVYGRRNELIAIDLVPGLETTTNTTLTKRTLLEQALGVISTRNYLFSLREDNETTRSVWVSGSKGDELSMKQARVLEPLVGDSQFTALDSSSSFAVFAYWNGTVNVTTGNLWIANDKGTDFHPLLDDVRRYAAHRYEFYTPRDIDGVYFANRLFPDGFKTIRSTNMGALWRPLKRPALQFDGTPYTCPQAMTMEDYIDMEKVSLIYMFVLGHYVIRKYFILSSDLVTFLMLK